MSLLDAFERAVAEHSMIGSEGQLVAAVSGGPDSMALMDCLCEHLSAAGSERIVVAHLHHGLRETAERDAEFVRSAAGGRGIAVVIGREDVKSLADEQRLSIEEAARDARYRFLARVAVEHGAETIFTGHNADDQAETVLMRALRGTGIHGLGGMRAVRPLGPAAPGVRLARPLLEVARSSIEAYLAERGITYCVDETNSDDRYRRNLVRLRLMPLVREQLQPRATAVLCRLAESARQAQEYLQGASSEFLTDVELGLRAALSRERWATIPRALRSTVLIGLHGAVTGGGRLSYTHVAMLRDMMDTTSQGSVDLPGGWRAAVDGGGLALVPLDDCEDALDSKPWAESVSVPGSVVLPDGRTMTAELTDHDGSRPPRAIDLGVTEEWLDYAAIGTPVRLSVRSRLPGDRFRPLGAPGSRSVKRFLIDTKVSRAERGGVPIVSVPGGRILWVAPYRIDESGRLTGGTRRVLRLGLDAAN